MAHRWTPDDEERAAASVAGILAGMHERMNRTPVATRLCGACGCLCRTDESCPSCAYRLGIPEAATTLQEMRTR